MNNKDWSIRHAIFDMIDTNLMEVPNKKQIMNFIKEDISKENLLKLYDMMTHEDLLIQSSQFLKECYYNHLKENSDLPIFNMSDILNQRDTILTEADEEKKPLTSKDIELLVKKYGILGAAAYLVRMRYVKPSDYKKIVKKLTTDYKGIKKGTVAGHVLPSIKTAGEIKKDILKHPFGGSYRAAKQVKQHLQTKGKEFLTKHPSVTKSGKYVLMTTGITGAIAASYFAYRHYLDNKKARQVCQNFSGKQRSICMIKFKISASDEAIDKLQEAKSGCSQKSDPEKCTYSINRELWKWQRRKQKYLIKLRQLTGEAAKEQREKPQEKKESPF